MPTLPTRITGIVRQPSGIPIGGAIIRTGGGCQALSMPNGSYVLSTIEVGTITVTATKGIFHDTKTCQANPGSIIPMDFVPVP